MESALPKAPMSELRQFAKQTVPGAIFLVLSGSHAYGFPSRDSDFDIRGTHIAKTKELFRLRKPAETIETTKEKFEVVSHELEKFLGLLTSPSGYVLEQIWSPYKPIIATKEFEILKKLSKNVICRQLHTHYSGFAVGIYKKARQANWSDVKENLYLLRILMTGVNLLETGNIVVNIDELNKKFKVEGVGELVELKALRETARDGVGIEQDVANLFTRLDAAYRESKLPDRPRNLEKFDDFLLKLRLKNMR